MLFAKRFVVVAAALLAAAATANAVIVHVPADQPTIQQGLDAASGADGNIVSVAAGTYTGALNRDLDFGGYGTTLTSEAGAAATVIDCQGLGRGFYFHSGEDTTARVQGFTIQNAGADSGAGALCTGGSSPKFFDCTFRFNSAMEFGGGLCAHSSAPVLRACAFVENTVSGGMNPYGGGVACMQGAHITATDSYFSGNTSASIGGGVYCNDSNPFFRDCVFLENASSSTGGGGAYCGGGALPTFTRCTFTGNTGPAGGAIHTQSSSASLTDCSFSENSGTALSFLYASSGQVVSCTFEGNAGGDVNCFSNANALFANCTFVGHTSSGAGFRANEASPTVENSIFAFAAVGSAAVCYGAANPTFTRCVVFGNPGGDALCGSVGDTLHRDPLFCGLAAENYTLCANSVCAQVNNPWGHPIGALDVGCANCGSAVEPRSWGTIKAFYR